MTIPRKPAVLAASLVALACGGGKPAQSASGAIADTVHAPAVAPSLSDSAREADAMEATAAAAHADTSAEAEKASSKSDSAAAIAAASQPEHRHTRDHISLVTAIRAGLKSTGWPVKTAAPLAGSLLPRQRIVAFYGNPLSKRMGILGEIPYDQMLAKLDGVVADWKRADPGTPVLPALHLIVSVAQGAPGKDSMYRQRSDPDLIEKIYNFAKGKKAITILDIQTGKSTLQKEIPVLLPFLQRPDVHLGIDPEFNMHYSREGRVPGSKIGVFTAADVNYAIEQLADLVTKYHLPPKVLVVHRFTTNMLQDANKIKLDPRVQVVINMDGWGEPWLKFDTYKTAEVKEPVQFTGFKLFYHNDTKSGEPILTPREVLALRPRPIYIQYQ